MNWMFKAWGWCLLFISLLSCHPSARETSSDEGLDQVPLKQARGFELREGNGYQVLKIYDPDRNPDHFETFRLVPAGKAETSRVEGEQVIPVPCRRIICLSSTQLTYFFALGDIKNIVATNSSRHLFHQGMNERIREGLVKRVGKEGHFNTELIASLNPDVIFVSPFKDGGYDALKSLGFSLVPMAAYEEETPLGRAEWIRMIAAFIGKDREADSIYNSLSDRYDSLKQLAAKVEYRPTVFSGKMRSGTWYVPGGDSFYAHYFKDAGADYVIKDQKTAAYPLDFETMYARAANCDVWRLLLPEPIDYDRKALIAEDPRYADFKAYRTGNIIACNIREKPYYEQNAMKPDVILADYIHFFHPELLPGYQPVFYTRFN